MKKAYYYKSINRLTYWNSPTTQRMVKVPSLHDAKLTLKDIMIQTEIVQLLEVRDNI